MIFWAMSFELFWRDRNPHQVEEVNCTLLTSTCMGWNQVEDIGSWLLHQSEEGLQLGSTHLLTPFHHLVFIYLFIYLFILVLPVYCYQPISLHPRAHMLSHVIPWTSARQTLLSMDFSRQEYWSGLPFPSVFLYFFALITVEGFLISPCYSLELCIQMGISFLCLLIWDNSEELSPF